MKLFEGIMVVTVAEERTIRINVKELCELLMLNENLNWVFEDIALICDTDMEVRISRIIDEVI